MGKPSIREGRVDQSDKAESASFPVGNLTFYFGKKLRSGLLTGSETVAKVENRHVRRILTGRL